MALYSMTGFAAAEGEVNGVAWRWELRSVNARGLDLRLRLPEGRERLEPELRARAARRLKRGAVAAQLRLREPAGGGASPQADPAALEAAVAAVAAARAAAERAGLPMAPTRPEALLALRGAWETAQAEEAEAPDEALLQGFDAALERLAQARAGEAAALGAALGGALDRIETETARAEAAHQAARAQAPARLRERVAALQAAGAEPAPERLAQELALLAVKADIREELDRLRAHLAAARALLAEGGAVGRRLDFLTQEFNREANTLGAKGAAAEIAQAGMEMKVAIDQLREQAANLE